MNDTRRKAGSSIIDALLIIAALTVVARPSLDAATGIGFIGPISLLDVVGVLLVALTLPPAIVGLLEVPRLRVLLLPLAFVVIGATWGLVVGFWVPVRDFYPMLFRVFGMVGSFLCFAHLAARKPRLVVPLILTSSIWPFFLAIRQQLTGVALVGQVNEYVAESVPRLSGSFVHPSELGKFAGFIFIFACAGLLVERGSKRRMITAGFAVLSGYIMLLTFTRIVWVAAPLAVVVVALLCRRSIVPLLALSGAAAIAARSGAVQQRLSGFSSLDVRTRLWSELLPMVKLGDVPLGFGFGRVTAMVQFATVQAGLPFLNQVHNDYLRIFLETGVVGLILYVGTFFGFIGISAIAVWSGTLTPHARRLAAGLLGCTIMLLITSVTDNLFQRPALIWIYWAIAGAALQQIYLARKATSRSVLPVLARARGRAPELVAASRAGVEG